MGALTDIETVTGKQPDNRSHALLDVGPPVLSLAVLVLAFWGLLDWDVPLTRFVRSLNDYHIDHLANPWLAQLSDLGDRFGRGESLMVFSLVMLAIGYAMKHEVWKAAGWQSLLAHGIAALTSNVVKHVIGRPRPKFMHAGNVEFSPAGGSGWDSFPSGHASASFAVAAVLAVRFPKARWIIMGMAMAIAVSRIFRGSHFLTDSVGGAILGYLIGVVVANPWREWRSSLTTGLCSLTPVLTAVLVLAWTISHYPSDEWPEPQLVAAGVSLTLIGLSGHVMQTFRGPLFPGWLSGHCTRALIGLGLGMNSGSVWVTTTVLCACLSYWLREQHRQAEPFVDAGRSSTYIFTKEMAFSLLVLLGLLAGVELRGALPMV